MWQKPIRLYWHENYTPKPKVVIKVINQGIEKASTKINLYPGDLNHEITDIIAKKHRVKSNQVILGPGIEGLIHLLCRTFLDKDKKGGMFEPSFFSYSNCIKWYGKKVALPISLNPILNLKPYIKNLLSTKLFFLASPNTGTGNYLLSKKQIEQILKQYQGIFVVDECYYGLGNQTVLDLIKKYKNLIVLRTVSKILGIAGIRFAYGLSNPNIIKQLKHNLWDVEWDPISRYSLEVFKAVYPYYNLMAKKTISFFNEYAKYLRQQFPNDSFIETNVTFIFMDISKYQVTRAEISQEMKTRGYLLVDYPENETQNEFSKLLEITPPPKEFWQDFAKNLKAVLA